MQNIVVAKPYRFIAPRFSPFWASIIQGIAPAYLAKTYGVTSWECRGKENLLASLESGAGVLLAPNHCRPGDPIVMSLLGHHLRRPFHTMASWHVFMQSRLQGFLLPRVGGFSVYREGLDRESLKCATQILAEARFPLVLFAEGFITRNNDRLYNLMDGCTFLARSAAKQRASSGGKVVIHPVFIRYFFEGDLEAAVLPVLKSIEARLSWQPQTQLSLTERIIKVGHGLLALKEIEYLGASQSGTTGERLQKLLDHLLSPLEQEWTGGAHESDPMQRIKRIRAAIVPEIINGELSETEKSRRWRHLADLYFAQQLHCYSGSYLAGSPSPERLLETVERYEEDLTDRSTPHPPIHAVIHIGTAIEVPPTRDRRGEGDPAAAELKSQLETMLETSKQSRRPKVSI